MQMRYLAAQTQPKQTKLDSKKATLPHGWRNSDTEISTTLHKKVLKILSLDFSCIFFIYLTEQSCSLLP